jgi:hypothetical protein
MPDVLFPLYGLLYCAFMEIQVIKTNNNCQIITMMALVFVLHGASYNGNGPEMDRKVMPRLLCP